MANDRGNSLPTLEAVLESLCPRSVVSVADLSRAGVHRHHLSIAIMQAYTEVRFLKFLCSLVFVEKATRTTPLKWTHLAPILVLAATSEETTLCKRYEHVHFNGIVNANRTQLLRLGHDETFEWEDLKVQWRAVQPSNIILLRSKAGDAK